MGFFGFLKKPKQGQDTASTPGPSVDEPPVPTPPHVPEPPVPKDKVSLDKLDKLDAPELPFQQPQQFQSGTGQDDTDWSAAAPEPAPEPTLPDAPLEPRLDIDDLHKSLDSPQDTQDFFSAQPAVSEPQFSPIPEQDDSDEQQMPISPEAPVQQQAPVADTNPTPTSQSGQGDELPEFEPQEIKPQETAQEDVRPQMFSEATPRQEEHLPSYTFENMPKADDFVRRRQKQPLEIFVSANDYARMFYEIKDIDNLAKHSFKTVMKIKDISGNQNNLLTRYHANLDFINERLAYIDGVLFENDET